MSTPEDSLSPAELLETAEKLFAAGETNMYRAAVLEAITALETSVRALAFAALKIRVGDQLCVWLEEKTRMDFDTRLGLFIPLATGLNVDKKDRLWNDYKKAKEIRNRITHAGTKVYRPQARFVIDTVYEWIEYLKQAQETQQRRDGQERTQIETLGRFIQASARLERVIYSAIKKANPFEELHPRRVYPVEELYRLALIDESTLRELNSLRSLRNRVVHAPPDDEVPVTEANVKRLDRIVDDIEAKIKL